jgi:hypothetical protein
MIVDFSYFDGEDLRLAVSVIKDIPMLWVKFRAWPRKLASTCISKQDLLNGTG